MNQAATLGTFGAFVGLGALPMGRTTEKAPLRDDQRGAVMVTGLFMASFLIGALWYLMGVGDAIVFRDRMQEAADHGAFTSAALHAKGMNFISACNIIMLVLVAVHIVLGIIHDFALAACIFSLGTGCEPWVTARDIYTGYNNIFKPALTGLHYVEMVAGYGYPFLGAVKGYQIGSGYGNKGKIAGTNVIPLSTSMVPGVVYGSPKTGLPVSAERFDYLCQKLANVIFDWTKANVGLPGLNLIGNLSDTISGWLGGETFGDFIKKLLGAGIKLRYCDALDGKALTDLTSTGNNVQKGLGRGKDKLGEENEDRADSNGDKKPGDPGYKAPKPGPKQDGTTQVNAGGNWSYILDPGFDKGWGDDGPYHTMVGNGDDQMQVWAINMGPKYTEDTERRVKIAGRNLTGTNSNQGPFGYFAQAEFYFDCTDGWDADVCNGGGDDNNASYAIKWRARLRGLQLPNFGALLGTFGLDALTNSQAYTDAKDKITSDNPLFDKLEEKLGAVTVDVIKGYVDDVVGDLEDQVRDAVTGALGTPTGLSGTYH